MITITYDNKQKRRENFYEIRNHSKPSQRQIYDIALTIWFLKKEKLIPDFIISLIIFPFRTQK